MSGRYDYLIKQQTPTQTAGRYSYLVPTAKPAATPIAPQKKPGVLGGLQTLAQDVKDVVTAPFAKQSFDMQGALKSGWDTISNTVQDTANRLSVPKTNNPLKNAVAVGEAAIGLVNTAFLGITAPLSAAEHVPVVGSVAGIINRFFGALGVVGADALEGAVEALPISDQTKKTITPLAKEVGALAAQVLAGKAGATKVALLKQKSEVLAKQIDKGVVLPEAPVAPESAPTAPIAPKVENIASWSELQKTNPELWNTGILRRSVSPMGAKGVIPADVHNAQAKWQNYGQNSEIPANNVYERINSGSFKGEYVDKQGNPVRGADGDSILQDTYNETTQEWDVPYVSNEALKNNLLDTFSTKEGKAYLNQVIDALPKNPDGTITAYRIGSVGEGAQSYTLSEGMAKTFSNQGTDIPLPGTPGLPRGGYKDFGALPANRVKVDPKGIKAWSPYDAEILVDSKFVSKSTKSVDTSPLAAEARKYKSAEEFVKAQGGIPKEMESLASEAKKYTNAVDFRKAVNQSHLMDLSNPEVHNWGRAFASYADEPLTDISQIVKDADRAGSYLSTMKYSNPVEYKAITAPGDTIIIYRAVPKNVGDTIRIGDYVALDKKYAQMHLDSVLQGEQKTAGKIISMKVPKKDIVWGDADFTEWAYSPQKLRQQFPTLEDFYNKVQTKSQLTDLYNKATEAAPEAKQVPNTRAQTLEKAAVEKKLTTSFGETQTHERMNMADQASKAVDFIESNPEKAMKIIRGEEMSDGILPEAIYTAMEIKAIREGDVAKLKELAQSKLPTAAGQSLKALDSADPNSPVKIMRDIQQAREAAAEKRSGKKKEQATKDVVQEIKKEVQKSVSKRQEWNDFIREIQCK